MLKVLMEHCRIGVRLQRDDYGPVCNLLLILDLRVCAIQAWSVPYCFALSCQKIIRHHESCHGEHSCQSCSSLVVHSRATCACQPAQQNSLLQCNLIEMVIRCMGIVFDHISMRSDEYDMTIASKLALYMYMHVQCTYAQ